MGVVQIYINVTVGEFYRKGPEFGLQNQDFIATPALIHKIWSVTISSQNHNEKHSMFF